MVDCDCKYAGDENEEGLMWCNKKNVYIKENQKDSCEFYEKKD